MSETILADAYVGYPEELAIFEKPVQNVGVKRQHCATYYPVNDYSNQGVIQFSIANNSSSYIDLRKTQLNITCKIVYRNGDPVHPPQPVEDSSPPPSPDKTPEGSQSGQNGAERKKRSTASTSNVKRSIVGVSNNFLHSLFSRVDVALQNKVLTHSDQSYPYMAYIKALLYTSKEVKDSDLQMHMFYKDTPGYANDANWFLGDNVGLRSRSKFFVGGQEVDMCGHLYSDVLEISRYIPYGVPLNITLYPSTPEFCLMSPEIDAAGQFKVVITKASLNVCMVDVAPAILAAHANILKSKPAIFPYSKSEVKKFTIARGVYSAEINDPFNGRVPAEMVCGLVSDSANHGKLDENPFLFQHGNLNFIQVSIDGQDMGGQGPIQPHYNSTPETSLYMDAYKTLIGMDGNDGVSPISRIEYPQGYCFYRFYSETVQAGNDDIIPLRRSGNLRVSLKFENQLSNPTTLVIFARFPAALKIDKNRAVHEV